VERGPSQEDLPNPRSASSKTRGSFDPQAIFRCVLQRVPFGRRCFGGSIEGRDRPYLHDRYWCSEAPGRLNHPFDIDWSAELAFDFRYRLPQRANHFRRETLRPLKAHRQQLFGDATARRIEQRCNALVADALPKDTAIGAIDFHAVRLDRPLHDRFAPAPGSFDNETIALPADGMR